MIESDDFGDDEDFLSAVAVIDDSDIDGANEKDLVLMTGDDADFLTAVADFEKNDIDCANNNNLSATAYDENTVDTVSEEREVIAYNVTFPADRSVLSNDFQSDEDRLFKTTVNGLGRLPIPDQFPFPFPPYSIQEDFMRNLFSTLDEGKVGIFESPTGTGKSLSLVCGAVLWLKQFERKRQDDIKNRILALEAQISTLDSDESLEWISAHSRKHDLNQRLELWRKANEKDLRIANKLDGIRERLKRDFGRGEGGNASDCDQSPIRKRRRIAIAVDQPLAKKRRDEKELFDELFPGGIPSEEKERKVGGDEEEEVEEDEDLLIDVEGKESTDLDDDDDFGAEGGSTKRDEVEETDHVSKIFFASRTHSQLSQFVGEVRKSPHGDSVRLVPLGSRQNLCINERVNTLKSVQLMNERCQELRDGKKARSKKIEEPKDTAKNATTKRCPFYNKEAIELLSEEALVNVHDIEDLAGLGRQRRACPYYAARAAVPLAQIIVIPYNILLHRSTREASGINVKDQVVVIDEAHNLIDTITSVHSMEVTFSHLTCAHSQLTHYLAKFKKRLKPENLLAIKQILFILKCLIKTLKTKRSTASIAPTLDTPHRSSDVTVRLLTLFDYVYEAELDHQISSIPRLLKYMKESQICRKLQGFADKYSPAALKELEAKAEMLGSKQGAASGLQGFLKDMNDRVMSDSSKTADGKSGVKSSEKTGIKKSILGPTTALSNSVTDIGGGGEGGAWKMKSPLMLVRGFLESLIMDNKDGRIVVKTSSRIASSATDGNFDKEVDGQADSSLRFLLLNPSNVFTDIITEARSVILAGGTMEPVEEVKSQLFYSNGIANERISQFSCDHVIRKENLLPMTLAKGPAGTDMEFTFKNRTDSRLINDLGQIILNVSRVTPGGIVVFFPSYEYERHVHCAWETSGLLARLASKKKIFREPKLSSQLEGILSEYSKTIAQASESSIATSLATAGPLGASGLTGAILFSVVGGKMSEGINFSDDLGRLVVMVGLPYPNKFSPELKEKMEFLDRTLERCATTSTSPGQEHYENLCMKAVNQSIGRAIRHQNDYAAILLIDSRSSRPNVAKKLPNWIRQKLETKDTFPLAFSALKSFFDSKKVLK